MQRHRLTPFLLLGLLAASVSSAAAQTSPRSFRDCSECPEMVSLPGGTFMMGVPAGEEALEGVPVDIRGRSATLRVPISATNTQRQAAPWT